MSDSLAEHHRAWHNTFGRYQTCPFDCGAGEAIAQVFEDDWEDTDGGTTGIRCGCCRGRHATIATVRLCHEVKFDAQTFARREAAEAAEIDAAGECEHALSAALCAGPQHYPYDADEQARGFVNAYC